MPTIGQGAKDYTSPQTKNITELEKVSVNMQYDVKEFTDKDGKPFTVNVANIDGEDYRIPNSVLKQLKEHLAEKPTMQSFKVKSTGTGLNTDYTVIPLD